MAWTEGIGSKALVPALQNKKLKTRKQKTSLPALKKRYTDEEMKKAIYDCYGIRTQLCYHLDCSQD